MMLGPLRTPLLSRHFCYTVSSYCLKFRRKIILLLGINMKQFLNQLACQHQCNARLVILLNRTSTVQEKNNKVEKCLHLLGCQARCSPVNLATSKYVWSLSERGHSLNLGIYWQTLMLKKYFRKYHRRQARLP